MLFANLLNLNTLEIMDVLLIDDSPTHQFQLSRCIKEAGHSVAIASSGEQAIQLIDQSPTDLIICDVEMPGLSGYETVSIIRESLGDVWVPIIFTTSRDDTEDFIKGFNAGADDYLIKPVHKDILLAKIRVMERFICMQNAVLEYENQSIGSQHFDEFTRVYNAQYFFEMALQQWAIMSRQRMPVSILIVDIDHFSDYVEYYGEKIADECLVKVSAKISETIQRPADCVGRFQKEGFIVMLPDTGKSGATVVAEKIRYGIETLAIENKASSNSGTITVSVGGGTCFKTREQTLHRCIELACESLFKIKELAGDSIYVEKLANIDGLKRGPDLLDEQDAFNLPGTYWRDS